MDNMDNNINQNKRLISGKISQFAMRHFNRITSSLRELDKYMYKQNQQGSSLNS